MKGHENINTEKIVKTMCKHSTQPVCNGVLCFQMGDRCSKGKGNKFT